MNFLYRKYNVTEYDLIIRFSNNANLDTAYLTTWFILLHTKQYDFLLPGYMNLKLTSVLQLGYSKHSKANQIKVY